MKKLFLYVLMVCAFVSMVSSLVSADLSVPSVLLGSTSQAKSNPNENNDQLVYASQTMSITNTGNTTLTNVALTSTASSKYNVSFNPSVIASLPAHSSASVIVTAAIAEDLSTFFPARSSPNNDRSFVIGTILASSGSVTGQGSLSEQAKNNLELTRIRVQINDQAQKSYQDGDNVKDIRPGDKLTIEFDVKNRFSTNDRVDISNVQVEAQSDNSDFDISDTYDISDISAGKEKTKTFTYRVDPSIDESTYSVTFVLTGEDDYGSNQGQQMRIDFEVNKLSEDIQLDSAIINPSTVQCDRSATITAVLDNIGSDDSDQVVLQWENAALGLKGNMPGISLASGDSRTLSIPVTVSDSQNAGTYPIRLTTYFDYSEFSTQSINNFATVDLIVQDCVSTITCYFCQGNQVQMDQVQAKVCPAGESLSIPICAVTPTPTPEKNVTVVVPPTQVTPPTTTIPAPVTYKPTTPNYLTIGLIGLGYLLVILIGIALIAYAVKRR